MQPAEKCLRRHVYRIPEQLRYAFDFTDLNTPAKLISTVVLYSIVYRSNIVHHTMETVVTYSDMTATSVPSSRHLTGNMVYRTTFETQTSRKSLLRLVRPSGVLFEARLNGQDDGSLPWRPSELALTRFVRDGENVLEIEVVSSLQNSCGPLHEKFWDDNVRCGADALENELHARPEFSLFDYGLLGGVEIIMIRAWGYRQA